MLCPFCKKKLIPGKLKSYETLVEHVCDPNNEEVVLRPTYVCTCSFSKNFFWDTEGDFYTENASKGQMQMLSRMRANSKGSRKSFSAIGSMWWNIDRKMEEKGSRKNGKSHH